MLRRGGRVCALKAGGSRFRRVVLEKDKHQEKWTRPGKSENAHDAKRHDNCFRGATSLTQRRVKVCRVVSLAVPVDWSACFAGGEEETMDKGEAMASVHATEPPPYTRSMTTFDCRNDKYTLRVFMLMCEHDIPHEPANNPNEERVRELRCRCQYDRK